MAGRIWPIKRMEDHEVSQFESALPDIWAELGFRETGDKISILVFDVPTSHVAVEDMKGFRRRLLSQRTVMAYLAEQSCGKEFEPFQLEHLIPQTGETIPVAKYAHLVSHIVLIYALRAIADDATYSRFDLLRLEERIIHFEEKSEVWIVYSQAMKFSELSTVVQIIMNFLDNLAEGRPAHLSENIGRFRHLFDSIAKPHPQSLNCVAV